MKRIVIQIAVIIILLIILFVFPLESTATNFIYGVISGIITNAFTSLNYDTNYLQDLYRSLRYSNKLVRISVAYLIRIKVDNKYLLVKGLRLTHQYQPVGGVYKYYPSASGFLSKIDCKNDDMISFDEYSKDDLRIRIKGKYIKDFTSWFNSGKEREINPSREFYEELIANNILSQDAFPYSEFEFVKQKRLFKKKSDYYNMPEFFIFNIFEYKPTNKQIDELKKTMAKKESGILWATEDDIETLGVKIGNNSSVCISLTSKFIT